MSDGSIKDFEDALYLLDEELQKTNHSCIVIKAIGGFAMLYHGLQDHGYTIDIDSLTTDFDDEVKYLISLVGNKNNLDSDWINTDCTMLEGMLNDLAPNIVWEKAIYDFKKIQEILGYDTDAGLTLLEETRGS